MILDCVSQTSIGRHLQTSITNRDYNYQLHKILSPHCSLSVTSCYNYAADLLLSVHVII